MDLNDIRENYKDFDDYMIEKIATSEAASLRPEVLEILKSEIKKRDLDKSLLSSISSQTRNITEFEINEYCDLVRMHPCPNCNSRTVKLNATIVGKVISMLVLTNYEKNIKVACPDCLDEFHNKAIINSALFGWWGIPWGPIRTIQSFIFNSTMKKNNRTEKSNEVLQSFVIENIGVLESCKKDSKKLSQFLSSINNRI